MSKICEDYEDCAVWDEYDPRWNTIDGRSKKKAYAFWESDLINDEDIGTTKALPIQRYLILFGIPELVQSSSKPCKRSASMGVSNLKRPVPGSETT